MQTGRRHRGQGWAHFGKRDEVSGFGDNDDTGSSGALSKQGPNAVLPSPTATLLIEHHDFVKLLSYVAKKHGLVRAPSIPNLVLQELGFGHPRVSTILAEIERTLRRRLEEDPVGARLLPVVKALIICADVAGSALPRSGEGQGWLAGQLEVTSARDGLEDAVKKRLGGQPMRPFQCEVAESAASVTLVTAGCGTGKTVAAIAWAAAQHPTRRLWLTYPTTGTATEGFRDYVREADVHGKLIHGRAEIDYDIFELRDGDDARRRARDRLESLREWGLDTVTCTVDTVLGLIQNHRRGLYAWPNIASGAIVFDEIHSYDDDLFGALLRFLRALPGVPALLMTASLPAGRLRALEQVVQQTHQRALCQVRGPHDLEALPRYRLDSIVTSLPQVAAELRRAQQAAERTLWVSNTVDRAMRAADIAEGIGRTLRYHSRFRYCDRVRRHGEVINAFRSAAHVTACTTQVAEMSLDLSADFLITDLASIPATIQRLGRLNRRSHPDAPEPVRRFIVLRPERPEPYDEGQIAEAEAWLERLKERDLSQRDLVDAWHNESPSDAREAESAWLDGGFVTEPRELREPSVGITVLLPDDARAVRGGRVRSTEVALPMNRPPHALRQVLKPSRDLDFLCEVPEGVISYDAQKGAQWQG